MSVSTGSSGRAERKLVMAPISRWSVRGFSFHNRSHAFLFDSDSTIQTGARCEISSSDESKFWFNTRIRFAIGVFSILQNFCGEGATQNAEAAPKDGLYMS